MTSAGMIEFGLAFGLIWTPLARRLSAIVLTAMFVSAILEFGKIDAIGHLMIIAILLAIVADDSQTPKWKPFLAPVFYIGALVAYLAAYYGLHAILFSAG